MLGKCLKCHPACFLVTLRRLDNLSGFQKTKKSRHDIIYHYIFIISQLWLTSHPRSTVFLLDTENPGTSGEIYSEDANDGTQSRNPSGINREL